jgi:hypothetical protein
MPTIVRVEGSSYRKAGEPPQSGPTCLLRNPVPACEQEKNGSGGKNSP